MGRRPKQSPFTLFSFQDIITSVTGIMVLVALQLALMIGSRLEAEVEGPPKASPPDVTAEQIEALEQEIAKFEAALHDLKELSQDGITETPKQLRTKLALLEADIERLTHRRTQLNDELNQLSQSTAEVQALEAAVAQLEKERNAIDQQKSAQAKQREDLISQNRIEFHFRQLPVGTAWLVDVHGDEILIAAANQDTLPIHLHERRIVDHISRFQKWCRSLPPQDRYFVFVIRPDGIDMYDQLRAIAEAQGAEIGIELLGNDVTFIDPSHGAVMK